MVRGFGAVFTDVDQPDGSGSGNKKSRGSSTLIEYFDADDKTAVQRFRPGFSQAMRIFPFSASCSTSAIIARVRIITGDSAPGPDDDGKHDIVMMDDFIYGEPQPAP